MKKGPIGLWEDMDDDDGRLVTHRRLIFEVSKQMIQIFDKDIKDWDKHDSHPFFKGNKSYICFLAVVRNVHFLFYMGPVGHSKSNLETRIPYFCLMGAKYF